MKKYTVEFHKNNNPYCYETFNPGDSIAEVVEDILYKTNHYWYRL